MSERGGRNPLGRNPLVPHNLQAMSAGRRRAYARNLLRVRARLLALHRLADDGAPIHALIREVDVALAVVRGENGPHTDGPEEAHEGG